MELRAVPVPTPNCQQPHTGYNSPKLVESEVYERVLSTTDALTRAHTTPVHRLHGTHTAIGSSEPHTTHRLAKVLADDPPAASPHQARTHDREPSRRQTAATHNKRHGAERISARTHRLRPRWPPLATHSAHNSPDTIASQSSRERNSSRKRRPLRHAARGPWRPEQLPAR